MFNPNPVGEMWPGVAMNVGQQKNQNLIWNITRGMCMCMCVSGMCVIAPVTQLQGSPMNSVDDNAVSHCQDAEHTWESEELK